MQPSVLMKRTVQYDKFRIWERLPQLRHFAHLQLLFLRLKQTVFARMRRLVKI